MVYAFVKGMNEVSPENPSSFGDYFSSSPGPRKLRISRLITGTGTERVAFGEENNGTGRGFRIGIGY